MNATLERRSVLKALALGLGTVAVPGLRAAVKPPRRLKIGYTCITWGSLPHSGDDDTLEAALRDISAEGFWSFETFPEILESWNRRHLLTPLIAKYGVPLRSGYISCDLTDPSKRKEETSRVTHLSKLVRKFGGTFVVLAGNGIKRDSYKFEDHRADILAALDDYASAVTDLGLATGLHQHTGTCIETRDEVYAVMESVNTRNLKFAPDVGQLQKGGSDAAKVVRDFLPLVKHMHLKDYKGWQYYEGYCPLGMGVVDIKAILDMVEAGGQNPDIMVELDPSKNGPMTPLETAQKSKAYLLQQGYTFRT